MSYVARSAIITFDLQKFLITKYKHTCCDSAAEPERVPSVTGVAGADGGVALCGAGGVAAADPRAGVLALLAHTCLVCRALGVGGALRLALHIRVPEEARQAGAGGRLVPLSALGIDATGRRPARINYLRRRSRGWG